MDLPHEDSLRWIVSRYARLRAAHGDVVGDPELVEPTSRFFPDAFERDAPSIGRLFQRVMSYAPLAADLPVALRFLEPEGEGEGHGGCGSVACGTRGGSGGKHDGVIETEEGYVVSLSVTDVGNPVLLTTSLARSVGALVLAEASEEAPAGEVGPFSELTAVVCGLGVLLLGGAAVYAKSCGGMRLSQGTHLSVEELAVAVALFVRVHGKAPRAARAHLEATQKEAFDEALRWVDSNAALVADLRDDPALLADGVFRIEPVRGLLGRLLAKRATSVPSDLATAPARRTVRTEAEARRLAEAAALVEEALREP